MLNRLEATSNMDKDNFLATAFHSWRVGSCVYQCRICTDSADSSEKSNSKFANSLQFWRHVKDHHRMASPAAYLAAFPGNPGPCVLRRSFTCGECDVDVAHDLGKMTMHMLKKHAGMDLREYYDKHIATGEEEMMAFRSNAASTANEPSKPGVKESVGQSEADSLATASAVHELSAIIKPAEGPPVVPEGFSVVPEEECNDASGVKGTESADSDDGKPLIRLRRGRKKKRKRKVAEKQLDKRFEENSDSEPIISDEEERNFTYQSLPKRACIEAVVEEEKYLDKIDEPFVEHASHVAQEEKSMDNFFGPVGEPKECPVGSPELNFEVKKLTTEVKKLTTELKTDGETVLSIMGEVIKKPQQLHWSIGCAFRCFTCGMIDWGRSKMRSHMLSAHKMGRKKKTERYEKIYNSVFTCLICNEEFPHELDRVHQHMKGKHNIAPKIYYEKYVLRTLANECPICKKTYKRRGGNGLARHMKYVHNQKANDNEDSGNDSMGFSGSESNMSDKASAGQGANVSGLGTSPAKTPPPPPPPSPPLDQKSEWYDGCVFACAVCSASSPSRETVRSHCAKVHHDAGKVTAVSTASYMCKICLAEVVHEKEALKAHFLTEHNTRLTSYFNSYEDTEREARSREKEERRRLSKEKQIKKTEAEAARADAERKHKGPKCPMGMCRELLESVEEADAHVGEVHGIGEDDVMTRRSVMNKVKLQLKWMMIVAS